MKGLTLQRLYEVLFYEPSTGVFTWKAKSGDKVVVGSEAGYLTNRGYRTICIDKTTHYAHRLAYFYMTGEVPNVIDHRNRDKTDNRWENLMNTDKYGNEGNRIGKGVRQHPSGRWSARIKRDAKDFNLGRFDTQEEARQAYLAAKVKYHNTYTEEYGTD